MSPRRATFAIALGLAASLAPPAFAQSVQLLGTFKDWAAYSASEGAGAVCFAMSKPVTVEPQPDGYTQAYLYLTHRPSENISNELNLVAGFEFAPDQPATLQVGGKSFDLFTQKDAAWLLDASQNDTLASAMRAGTAVVIQGTTSKGILVSETFSLSGATAASRAIDSGC
ncbi:MAG TPA: invasion associated locus B family protein [Devosia sp.]|nr:invasion associated locus B family protein [Devosia sp.]